MSIFSTFLRLTGSAFAVMALSACAQLPPDYSADYVRVPVYSSGPSHRIVGYDLVPQACLTPDPTDTQLGPRLPPGCANNANLAAMIERKRDAVEGRKLGAAPASPSARAAQKYIYGTPQAPAGSGVSSPGVSPAAPPSAPETVPVSSPNAHPGSTETVSVSSPTTPPVASGTGPVSSAEH
jgi:hypothetical protein